MKKIIAKHHLTAEKIKRLKDNFVDSSHYDTVIDYDCECRLPDGRQLFVFIKNYIEPKILYDAFTAMESAAQRTGLRIAASGSERKYTIKKDGSKSKFIVAHIPGTDIPATVESGIVGYFDRTPKYNYCRTTAFTKKHMDKFEKALPLIKTVNEGFKKYCPDRYRKQKEMIMATHPNYRISDTAFTTITVNKDYRTALHVDDGDYKEGFGNLVVYIKNMRPVLFVLPKYRIAINITTNDLLLVDVHEYHGNTEIIKLTEDAIRLSFVMYYRDNMWKCGSPSEELKRIKLMQRRVAREYSELI